MEHEVNRLARGLTREATKSIRSRTTETSILELCKFMENRFKLAYMQKAGATPKQQKLFNKQLKEYLQGHFDLFFEVYNKPRVIYQGSAFYWSYQDIGFQKDDGEDLSHVGMEFTGFREQTLQLEYMRYGIGSIRMYVAQINQRLLLSDHVLYRMIDRGECDRQPLEYLNDHLIFILGWVNAFSYFKVGNGFIPLDRGGLCLKTYMHRPNSQDEFNHLHDRRRFIVDRGAVVLEHHTTPDLTSTLHEDGTKSWMDYKLSTYLDDSILRMERLWAKQAMVEFHDKWEKEFLRFARLNADLDINSKDQQFFLDEFSDFMMALKRFVQLPRFVDACRPYGDR